MNITPYTPISMLRSLIRRTYVEQAVSAVLSVLAIKALYLIFEIASVVMDVPSFWGRVALAITLATSTYMLARAIYGMAAVFISAASARSDLKWMIERMTK